MYPTSRGPFDLSRTPDRRDLCLQGNQDVNQGEFVGLLEISFILSRTPN